MKFLSFLCLVVSIVLLASCSSTQEAYIKNINIYLDIKDGIQLTDQQIAASQADLIYLVMGEKPPATMALAFIENDKYKWVSRDNAVFVIQKGRLTRTSGLNHDLLFVTNLTHDPLKNGSNLSDGATWTRFVDRKDDSFGVKLESRFQVTNDSELSIQSRNFKTVQIMEQVYFESSAHGNDKWINTFWYHKKSGQLLKSIQKNTSDDNYYEITYISRSARLSTE